VGFVIKDENMGFTFNMEPRGHNDRDWVGTEDMIKVRQMFYWWDVNDWFNLTVGQLASKHSRLGPTDVWAPTSAISGLGSNVIVWGMGYGQIFSQRLPQVQGNFKVHENALLQIALIDPDSGGADFIFRSNPTYEIAGIGSNDAIFIQSEETNIPRIDLSLQVDWGPFQVTPSIMWMEHEWETDAYFLANDGTNVALEDNVTAWNFSLPFMFSQAGLTFEVEFNWGENWGNSNLYITGDSYLGGGVAHSLPALGTVTANGVAANATTTAVYDANGRLHDTECLGIWTELKYNWGMFTPGIFFGYQRMENDDLPVLANQFENDRTLWVLWCAIAANDHLTITPYFKMADNGEIEYGNGTTTSDLGNVDIFGVNFMVVF
jgi:hypothetical protein